jgi:arylformamidase
MLTSLEIDGHKYNFDATDPIDISIPLEFNRPQPNAYGVAPATSIPCAAGELVGDTRQGGSCNFEQYTLIPHCNGTHTECVGHITHERISVRDCLKDVFISALLVTVEPERSTWTQEAYSVPPEDTDRVITRRSLEEKLREHAERVSALILRTLPNDDRKLTRQYVDDIPPYFTTEAMEFVVASGFDHLLVDVPSIDRLYDEGKLSNHRLFWNVDQGSFEVGQGARRRSTITELVYVPNRVEDGRYLLNLQIAPFAADASPSRPLLFPIRQN